MAVSIKHKDTVKVPLSHKDKVAAEKVASSMGVSVEVLFSFLYTKVIRFNLFTQTQIVLSDRDWKKVVNAIEHPPKPNKTLLSAAKEFKASMFI
jgi:hypothetical protein